MIKTFCDRCKKETTNEVHGAINGIQEAADDGSGTSQATDCFDIICRSCFLAWRNWMQHYDSKLPAKNPDVVWVDTEATDSSVKDKK